MADVWATKDGVWSDVTVWNTGALPTTADDVYADGRIVYIDIDTQVLSISNGTRPGGTVNGRFIGNDGVSLSADVLCRDGSGGSVLPCLELLSADPSVFTVYGNVLASTASNGRAIRCTSSGTLTVFGNVSGGTGSGNTWGIDNQSTGTVNVIGDVRAVNLLNAGAILNNSTGTINVTGNVFGSNTGSNNRGITNASTGIVTVSGNIIATTGSGNNGVLNNSGGFVTIVGRVFGGSTSTIANASTGTVNIFGSVFSITGLGVNNATSGTVNIIGDVYGGNTSSNLFGVQHTSTSILTVSGNIYGGAGTGANGIRNAGTGIVNVIGSTYGGQGTSTPGIVNNSTGTINLTGNCYGYGYIPIDPSLTVNGTGGYGINNVAGGSVFVYGDVYSSNLRGDAWGIYNQAAGSVTVFGNAYGGASPATGADGIRNLSTSTGTIILSGTAYGGSGLATAYGVNNTSTTAIVRVKRAVGNDWGLGYTTALGSNPGVFGSQNGSTFVEELECGPRGQWPTAGVVYFTPNPKATSQFETDTFQNYSLIQSNLANNLVPPVSSVRQGEVYDLGLDVGTCIIPPASSVAADVPVDNVTGTAVLTPTDTWNTSVTASDVDSMGGRLRNALNSSAAEILINSFNV